MTRPNPPSMGYAVAGRDGEVYSIITRCRLDRRPTLRLFSLNKGLHMSTDNDNRKALYLATSEPEPSAEVTVDAVLHDLRRAFPLGWEPRGAQEARGFNTRAMAHAPLGPGAPVDETILQVELLRPTDGGNEPKPCFFAWIVSGDQPSPPKGVLDRTSDSPVGAVLSLLTHLQTTVDDICHPPAVRSPRRKAPLRLFVAAWPREDDDLQALPDHSCYSFNWETLTRQRFEDYDFSGAQWEGTSLMDCTFTRCNFSGATFIGCMFYGCSFLNCDLSGVKFARCVLRNTSIHRWTPRPNTEKEGDSRPGVEFFNCTLDQCTHLPGDMDGAIYESCSLTACGFRDDPLTDMRRLRNCSLHRVTDIPKYVSVDMGGPVRHAPGGFSVITSGEEGATEAAVYGNDWGSVNEARKAIKALALEHLARHALREGVLAFDMASLGYATKATMTWMESGATLLRAAEDAVRRFSADLRVEIDERVAIEQARERRAADRARLKQADPDMMEIREAASESEEEEDGDDD